MDIKTKGFSMPDGNTHIFIPPAPTETDRGGITAKPRTTEAAEVVVDSDTGKGYIGTDHTLKAKGQAADSEAVGIAISEKADRIISSASGENVILTDSAEAPLQGLKVFGRSTQDGEPTPENPVPIVSVGDKGNIGISIDGNPQQKLRIETPNGLPGIKVGSGGNYTDSNGQQWICDEIDLERGKYVQRVKKITLNGTETWRREDLNEGSPDYLKYICRIYGVKLIGVELQDSYVGIASSHFKGCSWLYANLNREAIGISLAYATTESQAGISIFSPKFTTIEELKDWLTKNNVECITQIETPIEHDLAPEEIAAYKALHTNNPTTVISNDESAHMEVTYAADTKNYILNREKAMQKQISDIRAAGGTLESAVDRYYAMRRGKDIYTVEVLDSTTTQACTVNRLDGLAGLVCEPSTNTTKGRDDVGALDAFRPTLCNWVLDAEGNQHITALQGMANYTEEGKVNVGVLNMGLYYKKERNEADTGWLHHWSMLPRKEEGYKPMKECVRPDNTVQGWMIHPRGACVDVEGVPYGCNGIPKRKGPSFSDYAYPRKQGPAYCYETDVDAAWVLALTMIKYGTRNLQEYMKGCTSYSNQYQVSQAENGVKRVILTTSQANAFVVGSCVSVGNPGDQSDRDRYYDYMHNIADSAVVLGIEAVDDTHSALVLDVDRPFDVPTTAWVSAMHWRSGSTSKVQGYDGSPVSNTDSKNICKINEIEILNGGWNVCGNSMNIMETSQEGVTTISNYRTDSSLLLTTNLDTVITTWKKTGTIPVTDNAWKYILDQNLDFAEGIMIPELYGGGERTGYADGYHTGQNPAAGQKTARGLLRRGGLDNGSICGPSDVRADYALSASHWPFLGSLSPNAVRGEWQATP